MPYKIIRDTIDIRKIDGFAILNENAYESILFEKQMIRLFPEIANKSKFKRYERTQPYELEFEGHHIVALNSDYPQDNKEPSSVTFVYERILDHFRRRGCETVAIPFFPNSILRQSRKHIFDAVQNTILKFLDQHEMNVYLILDIQHTLEANKELEQYIHNDLLESTSFKKRARNHTVEIKTSMKSFHSSEFRTIKDNKLDDLDEGWHDTLFALLNESNEKDSDIYKRANMDRKHFSKIKNNRDKLPSKKVAIALSIALKLSYEETIDFIERAGYTLSSSILFDKIITYFISEKKEYNIHIINQYLYQYDCELF